MEERLKLLYVEDDAQARALLEKLLRLKYPSLELYTAADGEAALEIFRKERPDLVVTDINMPQVSGSELTRLIKELDPAVPIIAVTAYHDGDLVTPAAKAAFHDYITKPVEYRLLLESLNRAIALVLSRRTADPASQSPTTEDTEEHRGS